eukprot:62403-Pleurochrysis_carterae.AAC.2
MSRGCKGSCTLVVKGVPLYILLYSDFVDCQCSLIFRPDLCLASHFSISRSPSSLLALSRKPCARSGAHASCLNNCYFKIRRFGPKVVKKYIGCVGADWVVHMKHN